MTVNQSMMSEGSASTDDSLSHKKRKLDHSSDGDMGEQTERTGTPKSNVPDVPLDVHGAPESPNDKQRVFKLLEPLSREQLMEILTSAATQHEDVFHEIKAIANADVSHRKVFVRGLAWETTTEGLTTAFEQFGQVEEGAVIYDKATGKSRGYGFVTFVEMEGAQRVVEKQAIEIDGRRATCNLAAVRAQADEHQQHHAHAPYAHQQHQPQHQQHQYQHPGHHQQHQNHVIGQQSQHPVRPAQAVGAPYTVYTTSMQAPPVYAAPAAVPQPLAADLSRGQNDEAERKLFVRGLSWDTTDESLRAEFLKFGELAEASVVRDRKTGKSKGFGFVTFRQRAAAATALVQPQKMIDGRAVTCNLASLGRATMGGPTGPASASAPYMVSSGYASAPHAMPAQPEMAAYGMYAHQPPNMAPAADPYRQPVYGYGAPPPPPPPHAHQQYYTPPTGHHSAPQHVRRN